MTAAGWTDIERLLGPSATERLCGLYGGGRLYIPGRIGPDHALHTLLGPAMCAALARECAGLLVSVPRRLSMQGRAERDAAIRAAYQQDVPVPALANRYGLTERQVYRILRGTEP